MISKFPDFSDHRNLPIFLSGFHGWLCPHSTVLRETREEKEYFLFFFLYFYLFIYLFY